MKKISTYFSIFSLFFLINSCFPGDPDCGGCSTLVENLVRITPIQSQFQVNDTLNITAVLPSQNNCSGTDLNIFALTSNTRAEFIFGDGFRLIGDQELIIRKGERDGNNFVAIYDPICDCYEFEADLVLSDAKVYNVILTNLFDVKDDGCDLYSVETSAPWINFPNQIEFELVP
ncbi:MAG: hypothetical protein ACI9WL_000906 [Rubritalea sp.]|jgi:hypothetical protein